MPDGAIVPMIIARTDRAESYRISPAGDKLLPGTHS